MLHADIQKRKVAGCLQIHTSVTLVCLLLCRNGRVSERVGHFADLNRQIFTLIMLFSLPLTPNWREREREAAYADHNGRSRQER